MPSHGRRVRTHLRVGFRARGGDLVVREGDTAVRVRELAALTGADTVFLTAGVSRCATRREDRLRGSGLTVRALPELPERDHRPVPA